MLIATSVLKFCLGTNFVTPYIRHTYAIHTDIWITIPRVGLKALELIRATKLYKVCMNFHLKIPLYQRFHTFFGPFHNFFSHLHISNLDHNNHLNKCYKTIWSLHGFSFENSSISTISHLFWRFHTFFHTFFKNISSLYNSPT